MNNASLKNTAEIAHSLDHHSPMLIRGVITPVVTPLTESGKLDIEGLSRLVEHQIDGGIDAIFALGTTGEYAGLSQTTKEQLIQELSRTLDQRKPLLVGIADCVYEHTLALAQTAADNGAVGLVLTTPYYFQLEQSELERYVRKVVAATPLPLYLYNIPDLSGTAFSVETVERLIDVPQIVGIKDSSGNREYLESLKAVASVRPDFAVLIGSEALLSEQTVRDYSGAISSTANLLPHLLAEMYTAAAQNDSDQFQVLQSLLFEFKSIYQLGGYGIGVIRALKFALQETGICQGYLTAPYANCSEQEELHIRARLAALHETPYLPFGRLGETISR